MGEPPAESGTVDGGVGVGVGVSVPSRTSGSGSGSGSASCVHGQELLNDPKVVSPSSLLDGEAGACSSSGVRRVRLPGSKARHAEAWERYLVSSRTLPGADMCTNTSTELELELELELVESWDIKDQGARGRKVCVGNGLFRRLRPEPACILLYGWAGMLGRYVVMYLAAVRAGEVGKLVVWKNAGDFNFIEVD